jgi:DNA-binding response OmpR family regulator
MHIAILDNDPGRVELIRESLARLGHQCRHFSAGQLLLEHLLHERFDLFVIDLQTADGDFSKLVLAIRTKNPAEAPILVLTERSAEEAIIEAMEAGAGDYMVKPVRRGELATRVQVLLKRAYPNLPGGEQFYFGQYAFEAHTGRLTKAGKPVDVTHKEFELALLLFRNIGRPLSRAYIREAIWTGESDVPSRTMDTHVSRVRSKLGLRPENGFRLVPVYSYGYRLEQLP